MAQKQRQPKIPDQTKKTAHEFDACFSRHPAVLAHLQLVFKNQHLTRQLDTNQIIVRAAQHDVIIQIESLISLAEMDKKSMSKEPGDVQ
jgi:hypothetical protein